MAPPPAFVICRDLLEPLRLTVAGLETAGVEELYLVDNDSTWEPLLDWYRQTPHTVIRLGENLGKKGPWQSGILEKHARGRPFLLTDPDVVPREDCPPDWIEHFAEILDARPALAKVGFSLEIGDLPDHYQFKPQVLLRQAQFWEEDRGDDDGYLVPLDTTMALYRAGSPYCTAPAIRTRRPYVARHLTWYLDSSRPTAELSHYRSRVHPLFGNWAKKDLPARVAKNPGRRIRGRPLS